MAAVINPTSPTSNRFGIKTALLYGVFVTERSFLIGLRKLIKREHAKMLAWKVCGNLLPQEIVDKIEHALYGLEQKAVDFAWKSDQPFTHNAHMFESITTSRSPANVAATAKLVSRSSILVPTDSFADLMKTSKAVMHGIVCNSHPSYRGRAEPSEQYRHLCASKLPTVSMTLPENSHQSWDHSSNPPQLWTSYLPGNGFVTASSWAHGYHTLSGDYLTYLPYRRRYKRTPPIEPIAVIDRLLLCASIQDSISEWDGDALKAFVDMLELEPAQLSVGDPLQPRLHIYQTVMYENEDDSVSSPRRINYISFAKIKELAKQTRESFKVQMSKFGSRLKE